MSTDRQPDPTSRTPPAPPAAVWHRADKASSGIATKRDTGMGRGRPTLACSTIIVPAGARHEGPVSARSDRVSKTKSGMR
jgi:hypothetical protein